MDRRVTFLIRKESVVINYGNQSICYHTFSDPHKAALRQFGRELQKRPMAIGEVISLAHKHNLNSVSRTNIHVII